MGQPKQLLKFRGTSLLRRAIDTALAVPADQVIVVLGYAADKLLPECEATSATVSVYMEISGPLAGQLDRMVGPTIPDVAKPHLAFTYELVDAGGRTATHMNATSSTGIGPAQFWAGWVITHPGDYRLRIAYEGVGSFERTITVP